MADFIKLLDKLKSKKILVIGDAMLDKYLHGEATRISPEAPVPVVLQKDTTMLLGGAANVAANLKALNTDVTLVTVLGNDSDSKDFKNLLQKTNLDHSFVYNILNRKTTVKTRIIAGNHQMLRIDNETSEPIDSFLESEIIKEINEIIVNYDGVILSDYGKGFLTEKLAKSVIEFSNSKNIPIFVDPKPINANIYKNVSGMTPNHKEAKEISGIFSKTDGVEEMGNKILKELNCKYLIITLGEKGMKLFEKDKKSIDIQASAKSVFDVTGAGDLVISVLALGIASGLSFYDSAYIANVAAGIQVSKFGNVSVTLDEIKNALSN